uniref:Kazal-like domain-containing protein n=1 Tax=Clastoptera arizonana TaxID=38151 RepID=A0A1B6E6T1_9HEMI
MGLIRPHLLNSSGDTLNTVNMADETIADLDCGFSLCGGRRLCGGLIKFAKPAVFITVLSILGLVQGEIEGYFNVHYSTNSTDVSLQFVKWMFFGSYVLQLLIIVPLCYIGGKRSRPFWLACFSIFAAILCILFGIIVLFTYSSSDVATTYSLTQDPTLCILWSERLITDSVNWNWLTLIMLYLIHYSIGLMWVSFLALGITFVDDNVNMESSPALIGVVLAVQQLGPKVGIILGWMCYTTVVSGILWIVLGIFLVIVAFIMSLFSHQLTDSNGVIITSATKSYGTNTGIIRSILRVFSNRIFIFITLALIHMRIASVNFDNIQSSYEESVYYATKPMGFDDPWRARSVIGYIRPVVTALAFLLSGFIIYKLKPSALRISIWSVISLCLVAAITFSYIFLTCSNSHVHNENNNAFDLTEYCNKDCQCSSTLSFTPVCEQSGNTVFYSPCHAGCTTVTYSGNSRVYKNCTCIATETASLENCHYGICTIFWVFFQCLTVLSAALLSSVVIGNLIICFRAVLLNDKPVMIALQTALVTLIANFPAKLIYDLVGSWSCIVLGDDSCRLHVSQPYSTFINLLTISFLLGAAGMFTIVCFLVRNLQLQNDSSSIPRSTEMTDFRSQLNSALKRRSLTTGEDQKLLTKPVPQITIKPALAGNEHRISTYEAQRQKAASYSDELNKLLQSSPLVQSQTQTRSQTNLQDDNQTRSPGETIRKEGMLTTLL